MLSSQFNVLLIGGIFKALAVEATQLVARDGPSPSLPADTNTSKYCSWWVDLRSETSCRTFLEDNFITLEEFCRWVKPTKSHSRERFANCVSRTRQSQLTVT